MAKRGNRDVELVIRARNEASRALGAVSSALEDLTKAQRKATEGSGQTNSTLSRLGETLQQLNSQAGKLSSFDKMASGVQKATSAVSKLEQELSELASSQSRTQSEITRSERALTHLEAASSRLSAALAKQKAETQSSQKNFNDLSREVKKTESGIAKSADTMSRHAANVSQSAPAIEQLRARYRELSAAILAAEKPHKTLTEEFSRTRAELIKTETGLKKAQSGYNTAQQSVVELRNRLAGLREAQATANSALQQASAAQEKTASSLQRVDARLKNTRSELTALKAAAETGAAGVTQLQGNLAAARAELVEVTGTAAKAEAAMAQFGARVRQTLLRNLADARQQLRQYQETLRQTQESINAAARRGATPATDPGMAAQVLYARQLKAAVSETQVSIHQMRTAIREAGSDMTRLGSAQQVVAGATARLNATTKALADTENRLASASTAAAAAQDRKAAAAARASRAMGDHARKGREAMTWLQRLRGELIAVTLAYTGLYGAIQQLSSATRVFMEIEAAQSRMNVAFKGNQAVTAREMAWVRSESERLGISVGVLAQEYSKLAVATRGTNMEGEETRRIFSAVAVAARVNKLTLDQVEGTFLALSQMVSKGAVSMEELRRQLGDRLYGAFILAADAMGMSTAELDKLVSTGQLASTDFLPKFSRQLEETFGPQLENALDTLTAKIGFFEVAVFNAREVFNEGGWTEGLEAAIERLTKYLQSDEGQQFFYNLGKAAGWFVQMLAEIPEHLNAIIMVLSVLAGVKAFNALVAGAQALTVRFAAATAGARTAGAALDGTGHAAARATAAMGPLAGTASSLGHRLNVLSRWARISTMNMTLMEKAAWAAGRAVGVLRGVLAALGGLPGILITGLSAAFGYWLTSTNDVIDAVGAHQRQMHAILEAYDQAKDKAGDWAQAVKNVSAAQVAKTAADLGKQLDQQINEFIAKMETDGLGRLRLARGDWGAVGQEIFEMFRALERGEITVTAVRQRLDQMVRSAEGIPPEIRRAIENQAELLAGAEKTERAFADQVTVAEEMGITIDGVTEATRTLQRSMEDLNNESRQSLDEAAARAEALRKAIEDTEGALGELTKMVPRLGREWKYLEDLKGIDEIFNTAVATAELHGLLEMVERLKKARDEARLNLAQSQVTGSLVDRIVGVESSGDPNAKNPNSTATGLGQFIESTWLRLFRKHFPAQAAQMSREAILDLRKDAELSRRMIEELARENAAILQQAGVAVNDAAVYLAHFLGPDGAVKVLTAAPDTPLSELLSEEIIKANESVMRGRTAGDLTGWAGRKMGVSDGELALQQRMVVIERERVTEAQKLADRQAEFNQRLRENAELEAERVGAGKERTLEQEQQLALQKAENDARRAGVELEQSTRDAIKETVRLKYEQEQQEKRVAAAKKEQEDAERRLNLLQQHRRDLMQAMELAQQSGDTEHYGILKEQLREVEAQLRTAIDAQIAFWEAALGGPDGEKAAAAIQALQNLKNSLLETELTAWPTAHAIGSVFGSGLINSANSFLDKIRETGDIIGSLREAFLQFASDFLLQIAKMIMQQMILNALQAGLGGAFGAGAQAGASASAGVSHSGGIAGSANRTRKVSPAWFTNAVRYHGGGVAGLKSNEVPAILERGETIRTKEQERALANRMAAANGSSGGAGQSIKIINQIDSGDMVATGIGSAAGEKALVNAIGKNRDTIKRMLG